MEVQPKLEQPTRESSSILAPVVVPKVAPVLTAPTTRAELSKSYPKILSDFKKFEVRFKFVNDSFFYY